MIRRFTSVAIVSSLLVHALYLPAICSDKAADAVYLKDGTVVEGKILDEVEGNRVRIRGLNGSIYVFSVDRVERIARAGEPAPGEFAPEPTIVPSSQAAVVRLRDGSLIPGIIEEYVPGEHITIRTSDGILFTFRAEDVEAVTYAPSSEMPFPMTPVPRRQRGTVPVGYKSPGAALALSLVFGGIFPIQGTGQFYNGEVGKGFLFLVAGFGSLAVMYDGLRRTSPSDSWPYGDELDPEWGEVAMGGVMYLVLYIGGSVDAYNSANRINRERGFAGSYGPSGPMLSYRW